jgi:hypothetical protein
MPDIPEPEQSENQRHPADTLNDGSPHKFFLFIPAFVVHFAIVAWGASFIGSWLRRALMLPWFLSSSAWILLLLNYVVALTMGLAIGRRLDRWFLGTGKFLWLPALLWFVYGLFESGTQKGKCWRLPRQLLPTCFCFTAARQRIGLCGWSVGQEFSVTRRREVATGSSRASRPQAKRLQSGTREGLACRSQYRLPDRRARRDYRFLAALGMKDNARRLPGAPFSPLLAKWVNDCRQPLRASAPLR